MMRREDLLAKGLTEEQVTEYLNLYHENERLKKDMENEKANQKVMESKFADVQKQLDEINQANMTKEEQLAEKIKQTEENYKKSKITLNTTTAKEILAGYDVGDDIISTLVSDDEQITRNNANALKNRFDSFKDTIVKQTKESIQNIDVKPTQTNIPQHDDSAMTWDKFRSLSQDEQNAWETAHPDEFNNL